MSERNITLKLTMEETNALMEELWAIGEDDRMTPRLQEVYNRLGKSKAKAIQRGCWRAPRQNNL